MLQREIRYALMLGGFFLVLFLGFYFYWITVTLSAIHLFGTVIIVVFPMLEIFAPILRGMSPRVLTNLGSYSIRKDDILHVDGWTVMCTGSIHVNKVWTGQGNKTHPILVFPSYYENLFEDNYICWCILSPYLITQINSKIVETINSRYPGRIDRKTPIYGGLVSFIDFSNTAENFDYEEQFKKALQNYATMKETNNDLRTELTKNRDLRKPAILNAIINKDEKYE